jgi:hypothetical protein
MRSRLLALLFSFLLLGMQQGAALHAVAHIGDGLDRPHEQTLLPPADDTSCAICALFAGGSNAIASGSADALQFAPASAASQVASSSPALSSPTWYLSRAPPSLL